VRLAETYERAIALHRQGELTAARSLYEQILQADPDHAETVQRLGTATLQSGDPVEGMRLLNRSAQLNPARPGVHCALGNACLMLQRPQEALAHYERALERDPQYVAAITNHASTLLELGRPAEATQSFARALRIKPDHLAALLNQGHAFQQTGHLEEAVANYERALQLKPDFVPALFAQGTALRDLRRLPEARSSFERGLALDSTNAEAWHNHGCLLHEMKMLEEALVSYERAIALNPAAVPSYCNRGSAFLDLNKPDAAADSFSQARKLAPNFPFISGSLLQARMSQCEWSEWQPQVAQVVDAVGRGEPAIFPFPLLVACDSLPTHLRAAQIYTRMYPPVASAPFTPYTHARLRVAYLSADFREHPVSQLLLGVLREHDRTRVESIAVSLQPTDSSELGQQIQRTAERFMDVSRESDAAVAALLRELEVDVVVDLQGFTQGMRAGIMAQRAAPIQVNYLGFAATMGAPYIDYIIADRTIIPEGAEANYQEQVVRLPHCYLPFDNRQEIAASTPTREAAGLPPHGFVFCAFNNHFKITPPMFELWMRLLRGTPKSCLWLRWASPLVMGNLRREAAARGIEPERIVFAARVPATADHLARQRLADLFLDTLPYNAHATAAQALWVGLPVLTCAGGAFAGRVAASLLHAVGLPQLITDSLQHYERLALELAADPARLRELRETLAGNLPSAPLFDTKRYCRDLEAAFFHMRERYRLNQPPAHFNL
jgi:protein O-GlcNAc transferase